MSARGDLLKALAEARPGRLDPDADARRVDPAVIMAHPRPAARSVRRPTRRLVLAGLVSAAAALAAGAVVVAADPDRTGTGRPDARAGDGSVAPAPAPTDPAPESARDLFLVAAERSVSSTATGGRYWVVSREHGERRPVGPASRPYDIMRRGLDEQWQATRAGDESFVVYQSLGAAPIAAADKAAWQADGSPAQWIELPPRDLPDAKPVIIKAAAEPRYARPIQDPTRIWTYPIGAGDMTIAQLAKLPTDPKALKAWLLKRFEKEGNLEPTDYSLFWSGRHLVFDLPVPPRVRAAAYRMLADVDGVAFLGPATDQRGRSGMAVAYVRKGDGGSWVQTRLIVDPGTGQALAQESWNLGKGKSAGTTGQLMSYELVLSAGFRDDAPPTDLPTR